MRFGMAAVLLALAAMPVQAQPAPPDGGLNIASNGALSIMQMATENADALIAAWPNPSADAQMKSTAAIRYGHTITTFLVFRGCKPDRAGKCNVTADFEVITPRGQVATRTLAVPVWVGPKPPVTGVLLAKTGFAITMDDSNAAGLYRIRATTTDHVANTTAPTEQILTLRGR